MTKRFVTGISALCNSDNCIEQMFVDTCRALGVLVDAHVGYRSCTVATSLLEGAKASALLDLLREEGFDVELTSGVFHPDKFAVVLKSN